MLEIDQANQVPEKNKEATVRNMKLSQSIVTTFLVLTLLIVLMLGPISSGLAQESIELFPVEIIPGLPDLTVFTSAAPTLIYGGPINNANDSSVVTITVQNRLTAPERGYLFEGTFWMYGAEARGVFVSIAMPTSLSQVGNMRIPSGFECAVTANNHNVFCWGGNIPAGGSVEFLLQVIGGAYGCGYTANVQTEVDPYSWIAEASETNNNASSAISVYSIC